MRGKHDLKHVCKVSEMKTATFYKRINQNSSADLAGHIHCQHLPDFLVFCHQEGKQKNRARSHQIPQPCLEKTQNILLWKIQSISDDKAAPHTQLLACASAELCCILSRNLCDISPPDTNSVHRNFARFAGTARTYTKSYLFFFKWYTEHTHCERSRIPFSSCSFSFFIFKFRFPTPSQQHPSISSHLYQLLFIVNTCLLAIPPHSANCRTRIRALQT